MGIADAQVVDVHAHVVLADTMGAAGVYGPTLGTGDSGRPFFRVGDYVLDGVRYVGSPFMDVGLRLDKMTAAGIDFQLLSPNPLTLFAFIESERAIAYCRRHNDALAAVLKGHDDRLAALAQIPVQAPEAAADELERAVRDLGFYGALIGTDSPRPLDDPAFDTLYKRCVALDVPLFIHPGPAGIDGPPGDPALRRFDLDVVTGFAAQEVLAVATLIYGGVLDRHPQLRVCLSHGGGSAAYLSGRLGKASRKRPWAPEALKADGAFEERLRRLWFDVHLNSERATALLIDTVGTERLVYGTNFAGWDQPDYGEGGHSDRPHPFLAENARRLLRH